MTDVRSIVSSIALGSAVVGIELAGAAEWLAKPALGGVVAFAFFLLQRRVTRAQEAEAAAEKALKDTLTGLRNDLNDLSKRVELTVAGPIALLSQRMDGFHREQEEMHARWRREHQNAMAESDAVGVDAQKALQACNDLNVRLTVLENDHATRHLVPLPSRS